jgi:hypothetical protein
MFSRRVLWERWLPVCDLVPGPVEDRVHLAARLEEAAGQLQVTQDEHQALQNLASQVRDLVLERSGEAISLAVVLFSTVNPIEGCVDAAATNRVHLGAWLALTTVLSHFPELELELELLGFGYNADLMKDEMEVFFISTSRASKSLSSSVPPLVAHSPPDSARVE